MTEVTSLLVLGTLGAAIAIVGILLVRFVAETERAVRFVAIGCILLGSIAFGLSLGAIGDHI